MELCRRLAHGVWKAAVWLQAWSEHLQGGATLDLSWGILTIEDAAVDVLSPTVSSRCTQCVRSGRFFLDLAAIFFKAAVVPSWQHVTREGLVGPLGSIRAAEA
eukprot:s7229_g4.t2